MQVTLGEDVLRQLREIRESGARLTRLEDWDAVPRAIAEVLRADPRCCLDPREVELDCLELL